MRQAVDCEQLALAKVLCHAAKHLICTVNGLLLGRVEADRVVVTDAVPLFHASTALAAPTEVALSQVYAYAQGLGDGTAVVGYYHGDARLGSSDLPPTGRKVADKLFARDPNTIVLVLDAKKLEGFMGGEQVHPFEALNKEAGRTWQRLPTAAVRLPGSSWPTLLATLSSLLKQRLHATIADFDDHLDDISKDWLNPQLRTMGRFELPGQGH